MVAVLAVVLLVSCSDDSDDGAEEADATSSTTTSTTSSTTTTEQPSTTEGAAEPETTPPGAPETELEADLALQVEVGADGTAWAIVDPPADDAWMIMRRDDGGWTPVASDADESSPDFTSGSRNIPLIVGVHPVGGIWLQEMVGMPEGPLMLWEFDGATWTDHTESATGGVPLSSLGMAGAITVVIESDGTVWTRFGDTVSRYDGTEWVVADAEELPAAEAAPNLQIEDLDALDVDPACLVRVGGAGIDLDDPEAVQGALAEATLATEVTADGAAWHAVACVGVVRVDPEDGSTSVLDLDGAFPSGLVLDLAMAPDGSVWIAGEGGVVRVDPNAES